MGSIFLTGLQFPHTKIGTTADIYMRGQGEAYYPNTPSMTWRRLLKRHNLPLIRLHDLRHSTAAILRDDGADVKAIQERLRIPA